MLSSDGDVNVTNSPDKHNEARTKHNQLKLPADVSQNLDMNTFRNPKTWKKSITNFFRNQLRSSKSNDGDHAADTSENDIKQDMPRDQKWQSLGKMFRRPSMMEHCNKSASHYGECSSQNRKLSVKKVISSYFGKNPKNFSKEQPAHDEY